MELDSVLIGNYTLIVRVVNFRQNKPIRNINVKVSRLEQEPITLNQWSENLKNGAPFKSLIFSTNTDNNGTVTTELPEGVYEAKVEKYGLSEVCDLTKNTEVLFFEPKKYWW